MRSVGKKVMTRMMNMKLVKAFDMWHSSCAEQVRLRTVVSKVVNRWLGIAISSAFEGWKENTSLLVRQRSLLGKVVSRMANRALVIAVNRWRAHFSTLAGLTALREHCRARELVSTFDSWRTNTAELSRNRQL
eukprot:776397-Rhodomonas_salina.1